MQDKRMRFAGVVVFALVLMFAGFLAFDGNRAHATVVKAAAPSAIDLAEHYLASASGPDDEGPYRLIDPIGPGGVRTADAAAEVYASTMQGGKYGTWAPYADPFATPPDYGAPTGPYTNGGTTP